MKLGIHQWDEAVTREIANLIFSLKLMRGVESKEKAFDQISNWFQEDFSQTPIGVVMAHSEDILVGCIVLFSQNAEKLEANPSLLGGHPLIAPDHDEKKIGFRLLNAAISWATGNGFTQIQMVTEMSESQRHDRETEEWYRSCGFNLKFKYVEMICHLSEQMIDKCSIPEGIDLMELRYANEDDLYACYSKSFAEGDAQFFLEQDEIERREYFDTLGLSEAIYENGSVLLLEGERTIGFTYVLSYGKDNCHISCMCVLPEYQGRGLGRAMLLHAISKVFEQGKKTITLGTETEMRAFDLYRRNGFEVVSGSNVYAWEVAV